MLLEDLAEPRCGILERRQVRFAVARQWRGHRDDRGVHLCQLRVTRGGVHTFEHGLQPLGGNVLDVALASLQRLHPRGVHLDAPDLHARFCERDRQR